MKRVRIALPMVCAACAVAYLTTSSSAAPRSHRTAASNRPSAVLVRHFAILRGVHAARDPLPARVAAGLAHEVGPMLGLDIAGAVEARPAPDVTAWLVPGSTGDCVVAETSSGRLAGAPGAACGRLQAGADSDISILVGGTAVGFVPDGNSTVTLTPPSGGTISAAVNDNAYAVPVPHAASATFRYTNAARDHVSESMVFPSERPSQRNGAA